MGLLARLLERRANPENPDIPLSSATIVDLWGGTATESGQTVTPATAIRFGAVWASLRVRSETFAGLPWGVYQRRGTARVEVREHPASDLLGLRPNPRSTAFGLREAAQQHVDGWGNGFARIRRSGRDEIESLEVLTPDRTRAVPTPTGLVYAWRRPGDEELEFLDADEVLHIAGPGFDGIRGYAVLELHAETIGYGLAGRSSASRLLANDSRPPGLIAVPHPLKPGAGDLIRQEWENRNAGPSRGRVGVLGGGATYTAIGLPPDQMQFIEQMDFSILDVARIFGVPPHKIGYLKDAGDRGNVEAENLRFVTDVLLAICLRWEQEANFKLFTPAERARGLFCKFDLRGLLRGDFVSRMEGYKIGREMGVLNADEIRALEDQPPIGGRAGSIYLVPLNMADAAVDPDPEPARGPAPAAGAGGDEDEPEGEPGADARSRAESRASGFRRRRLELAWGPIFEDAAGRLARRWHEDVGSRLRRELARAVSTPAEALDAWLEAPGTAEALAARHLRTFRAGYQALAGQVLAAALDEIRGATDDLEGRLGELLEPFARAAAEGTARRFLGRLRAAAAAEDPGDAITRTLEGWARTEPARARAWEPIAWGAAVARWAWEASGVRSIAWRAGSSEDCAACRELDGRIVGPGQPFLRAGDAIAGRPVPRARFNPPLHPGCTCRIVLGPRGRGEG